MVRKKDSDMEGMENAGSEVMEIPVSGEIIAGAGKKDKKEKSPAQLEANFRVQVNHSVGRVDHWLANVEKGLNSKKYKLTDTEKDKIMEHLDKSFAGIKARYEMKKNAGETFRL